MHPLSHHCTFGEVQDWRREKVQDGYFEGITAHHGWSDPSIAKDGEQLFPPTSLGSSFQVYQVDLRCFLRQEGKASRFHEDNASEGFRSDIKGGCEI